MRIATPLVLAGLLAAQQAPRPLPNFPSVQAQGHAKVTAKPDQVEIDIGVVSQARTAAAASAANATLFSAVMSALEKTVGASGEIQTISYQVHPDYRYPKEGGTPAIVGYTATNVVRITTAKVDQAGEIVDTASGKGANTIRRIHFGLKDERELRAQALRQAARNARSNAEAMAAGLGLKLMRVFRMEDGSPPVPRPYQMEMMARGAADTAPPTPVAPGLIEVEATVTLVAELGN